jgi:prepilin-type N-terminal cleavage/methylation domain-containing protein
MNMTPTKQQAAGSGQRAEDECPAVDRSFSACCPLPAARSGFTLTEILVVIVIIVLILAMAMPVFHFITGSRSEEGAANQIAAMLGRARTQAMGLQIPIGVLFSLDSEGQQDVMVQVGFAGCPDWSQTQNYNKFDCVKVTATNPNGATLYFMCTQNNITGIVNKPPTTQVDAVQWRWVGGPPLELRQDGEVEILPKGVVVQTVCNGLINGSTRLTDGYLSTGLIVFDSSGRVSSQLYGVSDVGPLANAIGITPPGGIAHAGFPSATNVFRPGTTLFGMDSQFGLVLVQREALIGQNFPITDIPYTVADAPPYPAQTSVPAWQSAYTNGTPSKRDKESWLDQNSTPLLINRYNGTLMKGD